MNDMHIGSLGDEIVKMVLGSLLITSFMVFLAFLPLIVIFLGIPYTAYRGIKSLVKYD